MDRAPTAVERKTSRAVEERPTHLHPVRECTWMEEVSYDGEDKLLCLSTRQQWISTNTLTAQDVAPPSFLSQANVNCKTGVVLYFVHLISAATSSLIFAAGYTYLSKRTKAHRYLSINCCKIYVTFLSNTGLSRKSCRTSSTVIFSVSNDSPFQKVSRPFLLQLCREIGYQSMWQMLFYARGLFSSCKA